MTKEQLEKILCNFWDWTHKAAIPPPKDFELIGRIIEDNSNLLEPLVMQKTADIGITEQPERPEDLPKTITVITEDFIKLITIGGSLCHPKAPTHYKQKMEGEIKKIALKHHINYVGEIKE